MIHRFRIGLLLLSLLAAGAQYGCSLMTPRVEVRQPAAAKAASADQQAAAVTGTTGAIFQSGSYRPLFEDRRARLVGDVLTIQIQEKTSARSSGTSSVERKGSVDASASAMPFFKSSTLGKLGAKGSSSNAFEGKGDTAADNMFTGSITVTVSDVLPNGNLLVMGEKQIGVNQSVEVMRFSGTVNPATIQPGNTVVSSQVADARLESRSRGDIDRAQTSGWLSRFFLSFIPI